MRSLKVIVPAVVTSCLTVGCIYLAIWLTSLVPGGEWAGLIKAILILSVVAAALITVAWSAYFAMVIRRSLKA